MLVTITDAMESKMEFPQYPIIAYYTLYMWPSVFLSMYLCISFSYLCIFIYEHVGDVTTFTCFSARLCVYVGIWKSLPVFRAV